MHIVVRVHLNRRDAGVAPRLVIEDPSKMLDILHMLVACAAGAFDPDEYARDAWAVTQMNRIFNAIDIAEPVVDVTVAGAHHVVVARSDIPGRHQRMSARELLTRALSARDETPRHTLAA